MQKIYSCCVHGAAPAHAQDTCYFPTLGFLLLHNPCLVSRLCLVLVSQQNTEEQKRELLGGKLSLYGFRALWYVWHAGYCTL